MLTATQKFDRAVNAAIRETGTFKMERTDSQGVQSVYIIERGSRKRGDYRGWWDDDHSVETEAATPTECWHDGAR